MYVMIDQVRMHDRLDANHAELRAGISAAAAAGASLVVFPECATTGFHRRLREVYDATAVGAIIDDLQARCEASGVAAVVGTPWPGPDGSVYNAALVLRPGMPRLVAPKVGLTPSEQRFFTPGRRAPVWEWDGWRLATLLCREVEDLDALQAAYAGKVDLLLWPGYIAWQDGGTYRAAASRLAATVGAHVAQCCWPGALNDPDQRGMGGSLLIDPRGVVRATAPSDRPARACWSLIDQPSQPR